MGERRENRRPKSEKERRMHFVKDAVREKEKERRIEIADTPSSALLRSSAILLLLPVLGCISSDYTYRTCTRERGTEGIFTYTPTLPGVSLALSRLRLQLKLHFDPETPEILAGRWRGSKFPRKFNCARTISRN